jgi:hypothetical protein
MDVWNVISEVGPSEMKQESIEAKGHLHAGLHHQSTIIQVYDQQPATKTFFTVFVFTSFLNGAFASASILQSRL